MLKCSWHKSSGCRPRERGDPVDTEPPVLISASQKIFAPGILGPRVRGDDSGGSLPHIFESENSDKVPASRLQLSGGSGLRLLHLLSASRRRLVTRHCSR